MAGYPARESFAETMAEFVERRRREVERFGQGLAAAATPNPTGRSPGFDRMYLPPAEDVAELRRQQAAFGETERQIDRQNSWMAVPALAPIAAVLGIEGGAALAAALAGPAVKRAPLNLVEREPYKRVGDNWATRAGRRAHKAHQAKVELKDGWDYEPRIPTKDGRILRPDTGTPLRSDKPLDRYFLELKPDTPTGRIAGARAAKRYQDATKRPTRVIYYNPKDYM